MKLDHEFSVPVPAAQAWPVLLDIDRIAPCMPGATITKVDGDDFEGTVKVKVGPITVTYGGTASFIEKDEAQHIAVIEARGKETRGSGTATAKVTAQLFDEGDSSRVAVTTDLSITGKPAQFGRGVMADVGNKLIGRFADCLAGQLAGGGAPAAAPADAAPASEQAGVSADSQLNGASGAAAAGAAAGTGTTGVVAGTEPATEPSTEPSTGSSTAPAAAPAAQTTTAPKPASVLDAPRHEAEPIDLMEAAGGAVAKRLLPALGAVAVLAILFSIIRRRR